jgi:ribose-phosphate pyrophosphokinase
MIKVNNQVLNVNHFPAGEQSYAGKNELSFDIEKGKKYFVEWKYENDSEFMTLLYISKHIEEKGGKLHTLYIPYLPNARMDRTKNDKEIFTLKHSNDLINYLGYENVYLNNPHSAVSLATLNNAKEGYIEDVNAYMQNGEVLHNNDIIRHLIKKLKLDRDKDVIYFPDKGCKQKYENVDFGLRTLSGDKIRDWATGEINGLEIIGKIPEKPFNVLMIDDICSFGGTFLHSAKKLREIVNLQKIHLFVTHLENSVEKGELIKSGLVEKIWTTDSIYTGNSPLVEKITKIKDEKLEI